MTTTHYKAVRPDGTDFYSGTILYEMGATVRPNPTRLKLAHRVLCGAGVLHAATVPTETLVGGSWPCRLFEVTGKVEYEDASHPHKKGFLKLVVGDELPAWQVFGPQGQEVVALINRAKRLTADEARRLAGVRVAAWVAVRVAAWVATRDAVRVAARDAAWVAAWVAARDAVRVAARDGAWVAAWVATRDAVRVAARDGAWDAAWDAVRDAALALVVKDLITSDQFDVLYGLWASVIEEVAA